MQLFRCTILILLLVGPVSANDTAGVHFFETHVRPVFVNHCYECHAESAESVKAGLFLDSRGGVLKGGESGPAIVPGDSSQSLLMKAITYGDHDLQMPPKYKLDDQDIRRLREWIDMGAPDPRVAKTRRSVRSEIDLDAGREFWSFQPIEATKPPAVKTNDWPISDVDRFILRKLEEEGLEPNRPADPGTLLRRVYFDLIGLPPTPEQIDEYVQAPSQERLAAIVDHLLNAPEFGERWGRHWLDVARFAESSGGGRSLMFEHAWRYRDYVIGAFSADKPFDEFIMEQIAGDLLAAEDSERYNEQLTASGFLMLGPHNYEQQDKELLRMEVIDEQIDTVGRSFLGMTLGCARCHDHKFDPIPAEDYYAMAGIFRSTESLIPGNVSGFITQTLRLSGHTKEDMIAIEAAIAKRTSLAKELAKIEDQIRNGGEVNTKGKDPATFAGIVVDDHDAELVGRWQSSSSVGGFLGDRYVYGSGNSPGENRAVFTPAIEHEGRYEIRVSYTAHANRANSVPIIIQHQDGRSEVHIDQTKTPPIEGTFISVGEYRFEVGSQATITIETEGTAAAVVADAVQLLPIDGQPGDASGEQDKSKESDTTESQTLTEKQKAEIANLKTKQSELESELKTLKEEWPIEKVDVAMSVKDAETIEDNHLLIRGVVRNHGPLVPRGVLQVATIPNQSPPEMPRDQSGRLQLAQWIASDDNPLTSRVIVNRIWQYLFGVGIVRTPDNFGTMGEAPSHPELLDYLASEFMADGWSVKRLIRQLVLSRSYQQSSDAGPEKRPVDVENRLFWRMNRKRLEAEAIRDAMLQISGQLDRTRGGLTIRKIEQYDRDYEFNSVRRSVYVPNFRNSVLDLFEVFDMANPNLIVGRRTASVLPTQSLFMMNSPFVVEVAQQTAAAWDEPIAKDRSAGIDGLYRTILGRRPFPQEAKLSEAYLDSFGADDQTLAIESLCHSLFASIDFRTLY